MSDAESSSETTVKKPRGRPARLKNDEDKIKNVRKIARQVYYRRKLKEIEEGVGDYTKKEYYKDRLREYGAEDEIVKEVPIDLPDELLKLKKTELVEKLKLSQDNVKRLEEENNRLKFIIKKVKMCLSTNVE